MVYEKSCGAVVYKVIDGQIYYLLVANLQGIFGFPKGHVEPNETEAQTALREVYEETNLRITLINGFRTTDEHPIPSRKNTWKQIVYFLGTFENQTYAYQKKELSGIRLATYEEALSLFQFESSKRILKEANDFLKPRFREMARKKQSLTSEQMIKILTTEKRGVLSVCGDNGYPYGLPINFWYNKDNGCIYFHSGKKGHKNDAIAANNKVSFCVYDQGYKKDGEWALNISSVIAFGRIQLVEDPRKATEIYRRLSLKFTSDMEYIDSEIEKYAKNTLCYELQVEHITGKIVNEA